MSRPLLSRRAGATFLARFLAPFLVLSALLVSGCQDPSTVRPNYPRVVRLELTRQDDSGTRYVIDAELAATPQAHEVGLSGRGRLSPGSAMFFAFEKPRVRCFWMRNTATALSVAFVDTSGRIVDIQSMRPNSSDLHCSRTPVRFALEVTAGWLEDRGLRASDRIDLSWPAATQP